MILIENPLFLPPPQRYPQCGDFTVVCLFCKFVALQVYTTHALADDISRFALNFPKIEALFLIKFLRIVKPETMLYIYL